MNEAPTSTKSDIGNISETASALFAQLVIQQANMAMMLLGKVPHPETGQTMKDPEAARLFIDQLEMLEAKTKGNLTKEELGLLKQSLMSLRLAFVDAVNSAESPKRTGSQSETRQTDPAQVPSTATTGGKTDTSAKAEEEHRKKFSKKY
jgi:hypothetical protein